MSDLVFCFEVVLLKITRPLPPRPPIETTLTITVKMGLFLDDHDFIKALKTSPITVSKHDAAQAYARYCVMRDVIHDTVHEDDNFHSGFWAVKSCKAISDAQYQALTTELIEGPC